MRMIIRKYQNTDIPPLFCNINNNCIIRRYDPIYYVGVYSKFKSFENLDDNSLKNMNNTYATIRSMMMMMMMMID